MLTRSLMALALASSVALTACGGGGGGSSGSATPSSSRNDVSGPLDVVQGPLSTQVLDPLAASVAGTPLAGVVNCVDQVVVGDTLDVVDALALALQPGAAGLPSSAANVQAELADLVADLQGLILSLAGGAGCNSLAAPPSFAGNPLAGTDFAALGGQLPALTGLLTQLQGGSGLSLSQLSGLTTTLNGLFATALNMVPAEARGAPVVGPSLALVQQALADLGSTLSSAAAGNANAAALGVTNTVDHLLENLLTEVIPLTLIEQTSGQPGVVSGPLLSAIDQVTAVLSGGLGDLPSGSLAGLLTGQLDPLLETLELDILPLILDPILAAVPGGAGGGIPGGLTGTPLDGVLATLTGVLSGGAGGDPLQTLLGTLLGGLGGSCPLAGTPLSGLCGILG